MAVLFLITVLSCGSHKNLGKDYEVVKLNFADCTVISEGYQFLTLNMPAPFVLEKSTREGLCEFVFRYPQQSGIAYVSSDVWYGSALNFDNRMKIGHDAYTKESTMDTILLGGIQDNGRYWVERIIGDYMVGYVNTDSVLKEKFEVAFASITKQ